MIKEQGMVHRKQYLRSRAEWLTHTQKGVAPVQAEYQEEVIFKSTYYI